MKGKLAMAFVLFVLSFISVSIRPDHHNYTFKHIIYEVARELVAIFVCEFTISGCFVSVEDFAAVINDLSERCGFLLA